VKISSLAWHRQLQRLSEAYSQVERGTRLYQKMWNVAELGEDG